jgi:hypothetical protein
MVLPSGEMAGKRSQRAVSCWLKDTVQLRRKRKLSRFLTMLIGSDDLMSNFKTTKKIAN